MDRQIEQEIRERAYEIWVEAGRMSGLDLEHWVTAERDIVLTREPATVRTAAGASAKKPAVAKAVSGRTVRTKTILPTTGVAKAKSVSTKPKAEAKSIESVKANPDATKSRRKKAPAADVRGTLN